ncbi:hypothetical protein BGX28_010049 [Mortierella sp. GBA30]|nr:hypothetical protein BGX28_010049 [Mortierella sp. GBA30]
MKPQLGKSQLAILKHAPRVYHKRRPVELRRKQSTLSAQDSSDNRIAVAVLSGTSGGGVGGARRTATGNANHLHPPSLLRRQTTRNKSFMEIDLPSMRMLRREHSMMELDPPQTLFTPVPNPSHFLPGPWAFFQAAEAQREQRQAQLEFLTRLQELRVRDEQQFVQVMAAFARDCPVQFSQLTGFMKQMEEEMALAGGGNVFAQQRLQGSDGMMGTRDNRGTKSALLELAHLFGNQVERPGSRPHHQQQEQAQFRHQQFMGGYEGQRAGARGARGGHRGGKSRGDGSGNSNGTNNVFGNPGMLYNQQQRQPPVPSLRRGKTFHQQQQARQQLTAYQRHLYQQVQQMHQQQQNPHQWQQNSVNFNSATSPVSTPMAHELMQYAALVAIAERNSNASSPVPQLLNGLPSPASSLSSGPGSPLSPLGFGNLMGQVQHQLPTPQDQFELAAMNMHLNMNSQGSSRRSRYKPSPVRTH